MEEQSYDLQSQLYAMAVGQWLKSLDPKAQLKGLYYVYLRGVEEGTSKAWYYIPYDPEGIHHVKVAVQIVEDAYAQ